MLRRFISVLATIAVAATGLAACGGSSGETVAQVSGVGSISKALLDHWIPVEASLLYEEFPKQAIPNGVIPDPPRYTACSAYLLAKAAGPKPTPAQLRLSCWKRYQQIKELTLNTLIGWEWTIGAGSDLGMKASDTEAKHRMETVNKIWFPRGGAEFSNYLKRTRQTVADMMFRSKVQLFEVKLTDRVNAMQQHLAKRLPASQWHKVLANYIKSLPPNKRWAARTTCRRGYVTSACKEYTGTETPGLPN